MMRCARRSSKAHRSARNRDDCLSSQSGAECHSSWRCAGFDGRRAAFSHQLPAVSYPNQVVILSGAGTSRSEVPAEVAFAELMTGLDEVQAFLAGERKGFKVHVPDEVDVKKHPQ